MQSINNSLITLIPKKNNPDFVSDFQLISLVNTILKIITKILDNCLQRVILRIVHTNQYGFIKTRTIQDCLAWSFEFLHQCHHSKRPIVILKLDFAKAFDTVEYKSMLIIMEALGFPARWRQWMSNILGSATSSILLNGVPGKSFSCKRGVSQGDPLSPLLCVLVGGLLQSVINGAYRLNLLKAPIP